MRFNNDLMIYFLKSDIQRLRLYYIADCLNLAIFGISSTLPIILIVSFLPSPRSVNSPPEPPSSPKKKKKTKPGHSSRISIQDQPETSFLPLIRNSGLLPTLSLASVSPWYVPQDNPLVSLPFPPTMGLSRCL